MRRIALAVVAGGLLALPAAAQAHVTVNPNTAPAGGEVEELVRVPNEQDTGNTIKVDLKLPPGFVQASYAPVPGWTAKVFTRKLAKPVQTDDGPVTEEVSRILWTGDGTQGKIAPGQFLDFPLSVGIPGKAGQTLTFKAIQTYDNGKVVRWIGPPSADQPAPQLKVTAAGGDAGGTAKPGVATTAAASSGSKGASKGLAITALIIGALGLLVGGAALLGARRRDGAAIVARR